MPLSPATVFISDLDGTLLRHDATVSPYTLEVLRRLLAQGLLFTVASARSVVAMQKLLAGLTLPLPVIAFNGAFISDLASGRHEIVQDFGPPLAQDIYAFMRKHHLVPFVSTFNGREDCLYYTSANNAGMDWYVKDRQQHGDRRLRHTANLEQVLFEQVVCFTMIGRRRDMHTMYLHIQQAFGSRTVCLCQENTYSPGWFWVTVHPREATKARAIRRLLRRYELVDRELVVCGDNINDLPMFAIADRRIAVANAVDRVKHAADRIIAANDADGVAHYLQQAWTRPGNGGNGY